MPDIVLTGQNRPRCQFPVIAVSPWKHNACSGLRKAVQKILVSLWAFPKRCSYNKTLFQQKSYRVQTEAFMGPVHLLLTRWACTFWVQFYSSHSNSQCAKYCCLRKSSASHYVHTKGVCIFIVISLITTINICCQNTDRKGIDGATSPDDFITNLSTLWKTLYYIIDYCTLFCVFDQLHLYLKRVGIFMDLYFQIISFKLKSV